MPGCPPGFYEPKPGSKPTLCIRGVIKTDKSEDISSKKLSSDASHRKIFNFETKKSLRRGGITSRRKSKKSRKTKKRL